MDINSLISIIKKKITKDIICESLKIEDKSFLHKNHTGNDNTKFHIKLLIQSQPGLNMTECDQDEMKTTNGPCGPHGIFSFDVLYENVPND